VHVLGIGLGEDRADGGGDHLGVALRHAGEHEVLRSAHGRLPLSTPLVMPAISAGVETGMPMARASRQERGV
jgi:hypothetical protein